MENLGQCRVNRIKASIVFPIYILRSSRFTTYLSVPCVYLFALDIPRSKPYFTTHKLYSPENHFKMAILESHKGYYLWNYIPSVAGAVVFILLFFTTSALHFWRLFKTGTKFCWPFALGCICKSKSLFPYRLGF